MPPERAHAPAAARTALLVPAILLGAAWCVAGWALAVGAALSDSGTNPPAGLVPLVGLAPLAGATLLVSAALRFGGAQPYATRRATAAAVLCALCWAVAVALLQLSA